MKDSKFDSESFYAGVFFGIVFMALMLALVVDRLIITPEACYYAEDLCYPEYENGRWAIIEGER